MMKQTYLAMLLLLPLLRMNAQNDSCIFSFKGKLLDENDRPIIGQVITAEYRYSYDDKFSKNTTARSSVDGTFEICIQKPVIPQYLRIITMQKYIYSLKIKINRKNHIQYSNDQLLIKDRFDFGEIYLKKISDLESPIPTDIIEARDLAATGQTSIGKALHYSSPGFNSTTQPVSDGGAHFPATDFRNLGAGRTMIQINGKRKNLSAYLPPNDIPEKSESGVDISSIPMAALEQVRIERQEATTLFGSDAIGGLVDFQLKGYHPKLEMHAFSGINKDKLDGFNTGLDVTKGFRLGNDGFFTITYSFLNQQESNRANSPGYDSLYADSNDPKWKSWVAKNPTLGMHIGDPQLLSNSLFYNTKTSFRGESQNQFYSFGGLTYRNTKSYAIYRAPYIVKNDYRIFSTADSTYNGFQPTFESDVRDHFFVFGLEGSAGNGVIHYDVSQTIAGNDIDFSVDSSFNPTLGANSPVNFKTGGYKLSNNNTRFTFDWTIDSLWTLKAGTDFRSEEYTIKPGEESSYTGDGTISYPGTRPQNSLTANRNNFGAFSQIRLDVRRFTGDFSARYERYSKFDPDYAFKIAGLFRIVDQENIKWVLRGSYSTGFRAPALQQLYYNRVQTLISGLTISNRGTFNTYSPVLRQLEVPQLQNESSNTFSIGTALNTTFWNKSRLTVAADYYDVTIRDRIVLSSTIDSSRISDPDNIVKKILAENQISSLNFFRNGVDTRTAGLDVSAKYVYFLDEQQNKSLELSLGSNIQFSNKITRFAPTPAPIASTNIDIFDRKEQSRLLYARPDNKTLLGLRYEQRDKFSAMIRGAYFGKVKWQHPTDPSKDQVFSGKFLLSFSGTIQPAKFMKISLNIENILGVYPDELNAYGDPRTNAGGRFKYYREVNQFGYNGTSFLLQLMFNL